MADATTAPDWIRRVSVWHPENPPAETGLEEVRDAKGFPWIELACGPDHTLPVLEVLTEYCPGLTSQMLEDLLTPDDEPAGHSYKGGEIRLASSFSVLAQRPDMKLERGMPQGAGVLIFQPVELLASKDWLITCWHPRRTFQGTNKVSSSPPSDSDDLRRAVARRWEQGKHGTPGDLGVSVMHEMALTYLPSQRSLYNWLEDWELSLYTDDDLDNQNQLPELWGLMAVFRSWLSPLNKPGLRADINKAWLPAADHKAVTEVDDRVDKTLAGLAKLSETLRQAFGLLHLEQTERQRRHSERMQHRLEIVAAIFLFPTLIVGFYGANTWVPGQGKHWGFWVMVVALVTLSISSLIAVLFLQRRSRRASRTSSLEHGRARRELLRIT